MISRSDIWIYHVTAVHEMKGFERSERSRERVRGWEPVFHQDSKTKQIWLGTGDILSIMEIYRYNQFNYAVELEHVSFNVAFTKMEQTIWNLEHWDNNFLQNKFLPGIHFPGKGNFRYNTSWKSQTFQNVFFFQLLYPKNHDFTTNEQTLAS